MTESEFVWVFVKQNRSGNYRSLENGILPNLICFSEIESQKTDAFFKAFALGPQMTLRGRK